MKSRLLTSVVLLSLALGVSAQTSTATNRTVFAMVREANQLISSKAKDKIVDVHSEKSGTNLVPDVWIIDYYDATEVFKTTEVKFVAGQPPKVTHPNSLRAWFTGTRPLKWSSVRIDSDRALAIALAQPNVKNLDLRATQVWLERTPSASNWKIRFWAEWPAGITDTYISSRNGVILSQVEHRQKHE